MVLRGTDPESYITEYALVDEDTTFCIFPFSLGSVSGVRFGGLDLLLGVLSYGLGFRGQGLKF